MSAKAMTNEHDLQYGSMFGWNAPGADPAFVEKMQNEQKDRDGGMTLEQSM